MMKLRGMLTQLRQATSSESCLYALRLVHAASWQRLAEAAGGKASPGQPACYAPMLAL
jgi:hypothetical protein